MRILPVLDIQRGSVVRGVGGRRREYKPISSRLTSSTLPADVAAAFLDHFGLSECYLADLDAIAGADPALELYASIQARGVRLWVDAGVRCTSDVDRLVEAGVEVAVAGLETVSGPNALAEMVCRHGDRVVFSLDLRAGEALQTTTWPADASAAASLAIATGVSHLIVLDLARVGTGSGSGTEALCDRLAQDFPHVEILAGGGIRGIDDLNRLQRCGVRGALIASALHDGSLTRADVDSICRSS